MATVETEARHEWTSDNSLWHIVARRLNSNGIIQFVALVRRLNKQGKYRTVARKDIPSRIRIQENEMISQLKEVQMNDTDHASK
ncbi:MAG: hypothetical protein R3267_07105 [Paenisporosarcina sp.]|nr:hypothetical protein [Paenisporosarcina sp.]